MIAALTKVKPFGRKSRSSAAAILSYIVRERCDARATHERQGDPSRAFPLPRKSFMRFHLFTPADVSCGERFTAFF
jgi:hypothetical protein